MAVSVIPIGAGMLIASVGIALVCAISATVAVTGLASSGVVIVAVPMPGHVVTSAFVHALDSTERRGERLNGMTRLTVWSSDSSYFWVMVAVTASPSSLASSAAVPAM